ncbi:MAG: TonB-dependent receptor, partial [Chlorobiales bacterium]|nr:TonB-dependent receptor [Chlorobiales bacterium]
WSVYSFDESTVDGLSIGGGFIWTDERVRSTAGAAQALKKLNGEVLFYEAETRLDLFAKYDWENWSFSLNLRNLTEEVNLSNNVPRVPLQGGVRPDGSPYVFDGDMEVMLGVRYRYE